MYIEGQTLDDLLQPVFRRALKSKVVTRSSKGPARELMGVMLKLTNPRARFSRTERRATLLSCLGETLWYFSGSDALTVVEHYIPAYREFLGVSKRATRAPGAYGPRIFGGKAPSQIEKVIELLRRKPDTRQAVVQLYGASDLGKKDVPCTCTLQFLARSGRMHMMTSMRSNDAYLGLPHDVFAFTLLQEVVARTMGCELGEYNHAVGSLHLYEEHERRAREYLDEGWQDKLAMPAMPVGDPWNAIKWLLDKEARIRCGVLDIGDVTAIDPFWVDLARLLLVHAHLKRKDRRAIVEVKNAMAAGVYDAFIRAKATSVPAPVDAPLLEWTKP
ncbi:MAG: thymidylate synthase [Hyphomicrobium sp.]|nr:thymidylate synthase [Hyphomicrobium sp.]